VRVAKKPEAVITTLQFVDLTKYRTAREIMDLPYSKMVQALEDQERQARKNETMGVRGLELLQALQAGAVIQAEVAGKSRKFTARSGEVVFHVKPAHVDALARRGFLVGVPAPAKRKARPITVAEAQRICGTT
jgi:hypothetical protein